MSMSLSSSCLFGLNVVVPTIARHPPFFFSILKHHRFFVWCGLGTLQHNLPAFFSIQSSNRHITCLHAQSTHAASASFCTFIAYFCSCLAIGNCCYRELYFGSENMHLQQRFTSRHQMKLARGLLFRFSGLARLRIISTLHRLAATLNSVPRLQSSKSSNHILRVRHGS